MQWFQEDIVIKIICVGKLKDKHLHAIEDHFLKQLKLFHKIEIVEVKDCALTDKENDKQTKIILDIEAKNVLEKIKDEYMILLDLHGEMISSLALANKFEQLFTRGISNITFVIGGSLGVSDLLIQRSNMRLCISKMTFTHQFCRIILLEQIYRAFKINRNEVYHK